MTNYIQRLTKVSRSAFKAGLETGKVGLRLATYCGLSAHAVPTFFKQASIEAKKARNLASRVHADALHRAVSIGRLEATASGYSDAGYSDAASLRLERELSERELSAIDRKKVSDTQLGLGMDLLSKLAILSGIAGAVTYGAIHPALLAIPMLTNGASALYEWRRSKKAGED